MVRFLPDGEDGVTCGKEARATKTLTEPMSFVIDKGFNEETEAHGWYKIFSEEIDAHCC